MYRRERTPLYDAFFSAPNIETIQMGIIKETFAKTGENIGRQDARPLTIIMESIYSTNAMDYYGNIQPQLDQMNQAVVVESSRQTIMGVDAYKRYIRDITGYPQVNQLPDPVSTSEVGKKIPMNNKYAF
jgi:hypothetical protein